MSEPAVARFPVNPARFGPEWFACYAASWTVRWREAGSGYVTKSPAGHTCANVAKVDVARLAIQDADAAIAAFIEATEKA